MYIQTGGNKQNMLGLICPHNNGDDAALPGTSNTAYAQAASNLLTMAIIIWMVTNSINNRVSHYPYLMVIALKPFVIIDDKGIIMANACMVAHVPDHHIQAICCFNLKEMFGKIYSDCMLLNSANIELF